MKRATLTALLLTTALNAHAVCKQVGPDGLVAYSNGCGTLPTPITQRNSDHKPRQAADQREQERQSAVDELEALKNQYEKDNKTREETLKSFDEAEEKLNKP